MILDVFVEINRSPCNATSPRSVLIEVEFDLLFYNHSTLVLNFFPLSMTFKSIHVLLIFLLPLIAASQDYTDYYILINTAEEMFVEEQSSSCFEQYDAAFERFDPFVKDPYIASQIALYLNDTVRFMHYLEICFENAMPLSSVNASLIIRNANKGHLHEQIVDLHTRTFKPKTVNEQWDDAIYLFGYESDSIKTNHGVTAEFHEREDAAREFLVERFLTYGMFPNERLLGISTAERDRTMSVKHHKMKLFEVDPEQDFELRLKCPFNIVLHSKCFYTVHRELFMLAMQNGYLHPKDIGILEETAVMWNDNSDNLQDDCAPPAYQPLYNILGYNPLKHPAKQIFNASEEGLMVVERNRAQIHMQKYSVDVAKKEMQKTWGFKFFFDFIDR